MYILQIYYTVHHYLQEADRPSVKTQIVERRIKCETKYLY